MKKIISIILFFLSSYSYATNFYASTTSGGSNLGTLSNPYTSLASVQSHQSSFNSGDNILFLRTDTFPGIWSLSRNNIKISCYGAGTSLPVFTGNGRTRIDQLFYVNNLTGVTIANLFFYDPTLAGDVTRDSLSHIKIAINFDGSSNHDTIINCKFSLVGDGYLENAAGYTCCRYCEFWNLRMVVNNGVGDFGATSATWAHKHNDFSYNYSHGCWAKSLAFTFDGGVVEWSGNGTDSNTVTYNRADSCDGMGEIDGDSKDNIIAFNIFTNCGFIADWHSGSTYSGWVFYNNTILETVPSITTNTGCFHGTINAVTLTNNVFYLRSAFNVSPSGTGITHTYNRYNVASGASIGYSLATGEVSSTATMFADQSQSNPALWNIRPLDGTVLSSGTPGGVGGFNVDYYGVAGINNYLGVSKFVSPQTFNGITLPTNFIFPNGSVHKVGVITTQ